MAAKDHKVTVKTTEKCKVLVDKLEKLKLTEGKSVRLFHGGKEMKYEDLVGNHAAEDSVVTVFLRNPQPQ